MSKIDQIQVGFERAKNSIEKMAKAINEMKKPANTWVNSLNCSLPPTKQLQGTQRIDRNKPCPCGSGVKYKKCKEHL